MSSATVKTVVPDKTYGRTRENRKWNWTGLEKFDICFCILFDCYFYKVYFFEREIGH